MSYKRIATVISLLHEIKIMGDIFNRLKNREAVPFTDRDYGKISAACAETAKLLSEFNKISEPEQRRKILADITGSDIEASVRVMSPLYINYGKNTALGKNVFINFGCTFLDLGGIEIQDDVLVAPGVKLLSEGHPTNPRERQQLTAAKITIKKNVWIGANAVILPGVTIGVNSVVAAGAVVSKDVPQNVVVGGIPAKILKHL